MISQGSLSHSAMARSVLPDAVGPIKKMAGGFDGWFDDTLAPSQKQFVQLCQRNEGPGGAPMIALTTTLGGFHIP